MVNATPRPLYSRERDPVPTVQEAGRAPGPVWTGAENLAPTGIRSPVERQHTVGRMERGNKQVTVRTRRKHRFQRNYVGTI